MVPGWSPEMPPIVGQIEPMAFLNPLIEDNDLFNLSNILQMELVAEIWTPIQRRSSCRDITCSSSPALVSVI